VFNFRLPSNDDIRPNTSYYDYVLSFDVLPAVRVKSAALLDVILPVAWLEAYSSILKKETAYLLSHLAYSLTVWMEVVYSIESSVNFCQITHDHLQRTLIFLSQMCFPESIVQCLWSSNKSYLNMAPASIVFLYPSLFSGFPTKATNGGFAVVDYTNSWTC
jgi:hypothetical protein